MRGLEIRISNLYGLGGEHTFQLRKGLNILAAPNAQGVSSIFRSLALLFGEEDLDGALHATKDKGYVELVDGEKTYKCTVERASGGTFAEHNIELRNSKLAYTVVVNEKHPLTYWNLSSQGVQEFLTSITGVEELRAQVVQDEKSLEKKTEERDQLEAEMKASQSIKSQLDEAVDEVRRIRRERVEFLRSSDLSGVSEEELATRLPKAFHEVKQRYEEWNRLLEEIQGLQGELSKKEEEYKKKEEQFDVPSLEEQLKRIEEEYRVVNARKNSAYRECSLYSAYTTFTPDRAECPICSLARFPCNHSKFDQTELRRRAEQVMKTKQREKVSLEKKEKKLMMEKSTLKARKRVWSEELREIRADINRRRSKLKSLKEGVEAAEQSYVEAHKELKRLERSSKMIDKVASKIGEINFEENRLQRRIRELQKLAEEKTKKEEKLENLNSTIKKTDERLKTKRKEYEKAVHGAREIFNKSSRELMKSLHFERFSDIQIDEEFNIKVSREGFDQEVNTLSTSEATTITVLLTLAAKKNYHPDNPILAIDTVSTAYDPSTLKWLANWLVDQVPTVMVSKLTPKEEGRGIRILHQIR